MQLSFFRRALVPSPDTLCTLKYLSDNHVKMGLISIFSADVAHLWPVSAFSELVDYPVFSCVCGLSKPDTAIYLQTCKGLKKEPRECIYVDDVLEFLMGAMQAGMKALLIDNGVDSVEWEGDSVMNVHEVTRLLD